MSFFEIYYNQLVDNGIIDPRLALGLLGAVLLLLIVQLYYYLGVYGRLPRYRNNRGIDPQTVPPPVSVIVVARENSYYFIEHTLPLLLGQQYHQYEVVVVDCSYDEEIGLLLNEKISWLEYGKVGMILFFLFLTVCVIEGISSLLSQIIREERSLSPLGKRLLTGAAVLLALVCTLSLQPPDFSHISPRAVQAMISGLFHPDWAFFFETDTSGLGYLLLETVCIALVGTCAGTVIAVPLSFLSTPCLMPKLPALLFRVVIMAIRSVPFLIYGLIFIRVAGPGPFTGVLTLGVCSVGLLSKRFTEAIESLDFRAYHALESMGVPLLLRIRYAVLPQLLPALASAVLYRFDVNIREASVLGLVGAGGIGAPLIFAMNHYKWSEAGAIALGLILLVWCIDRLSASLRR